jgi:hypothetical protein
MEPPKKIRPYTDAELVSLRILRAAKKLTVKEATEMCSRLGIQPVASHANRYVRKPIPKDLPKFVRMRMMRERGRGKQHRPKKKNWLLPEDAVTFLRDYYRQVGERALARVR